MYSAVMDEVCRVKTDFNFDFSKAYTDNISHPLLIELFNIIQNFISENFEKSNFSYATIQKAYSFDNFAVRIVYKKECNFMETTQKILDHIIDHNVKTISYRYKNKIHYLTEKYLDDVYENLPWATRIDSFMQNNMHVGNLVHSVIGKWLRNTTNCIGLSGESAFYTLMCSGKRYFVGKNDEVKEDAKRFGIEVENFDLDSSFTVVCNARKGLEKYKQYVENVHEIILISCNQEKRERDEKYLSKNYEIIEKIQITQSNYVILFRRINYVSLGSICGIAYQLQERKLRKCAYPFDWIEIKKLKTITELLKSNFAGFLNFIKNDPKFTNKYPYIMDDNFEENDTQTFFVKNQCGLIFPHDFTGDFDSQVDKVILKYERRINRLFELIRSNELVRFVRYESNEKNITEGDINNFIEILKEINPDIKMEILLVIRNCKKCIENVHVHTYNDDSQFTGWKLETTNWNIIL